MKKIFYITALLFTCINATLAQQQLGGGLTIVWQKSTPASIPSYWPGPNETYTLLSDSTIVYLTSTFNPDKFTDSLTLNKIDLQGNVLLAKPFITSPANGGVSPVIKMVTTPDGNFAVLINSNVYNNTTNKLYKFNNNLDQLWAKNLTGSVNSSFSSFNVLPNNGFALVSALYRGFYPRIFLEGSAMLGLNPMGDSIFYKISGDFVNYLSASNNTIITFLSSLYGIRPVAYAVLNANNGNLIKTIDASKPAPARISNVVYYPSQNSYLSLVRANPVENAYPLPANLSLLKSDSILNTTGKINYNNISNLGSSVNGEGTKFVTDNADGLYYYQYDLASTSPNTPERFEIGRLDASGNATWSTRLINPGFNKRVLNIFPLSATEFLLFAFDEPNSKITVYRVKRDVNIPSQFASFGNRNTSGSITRNIEKATAVTDELSVKVIANPSSSFFNLVTKSNSNQTLGILVTDAMNRIIEERKQVTANNVIEIGSTYKAGIYFVTIVQGNKSKTVKLIKQ